MSIHIVAAGRGNVRPLWEDAWNVTADLYVWKTPRDLDDERALALVEAWQQSGGDPVVSPFEPSSDVGWLHRELMQEFPGLETLSDAVPSLSTTPIWLSTEPEPPARVVAVRLSPATARDVLDSIFGLAMKYDLVVFDARNGKVHLPLEEMAAHASATFWPDGAIRAVVAGGIGGLVAVVAWFLGIPLLSGLLMLAGGFTIVLTVFTLIHEGQKARKTPGGG